MEEYLEESIEASNTDDIAGVYDKELDDKMISNCEKKELLETGIEKATFNIAINMLKNNEPTKKIELYMDLSKEKNKIITK